MLQVQGYGGSQGETSHLASQVSQLSEQLQAAQAATAAAQQEARQLKHKQQVTSQNLEHCLGNWYLAWIAACNILSALLSITDCHRMSHVSSWQCQNYSLACM